MTVGHVDSVGHTLTGREAGGDFRPTRFSRTNYSLFQGDSTIDMERFALAPIVKEMTRRTHACRRPAEIIQYQFAGAPFGSAYVRISSGEQGEYGASNHNRLHLCGAGLEPRGH
jgi:hypothetical protein